MSQNPPKYEKTGQIAVTLQRMNLWTRKNRIADMMPERSGEMNQDNTRKWEAQSGSCCWKRKLRDTWGSTAGVVPPAGLTNLQQLRPLDTFLPLGHQ